MPRRKKRGSGFWLAAPVWLIVAALVAWGIWQAAVFRRSMMSEARATADISQTVRQDTGNVAETMPETEPSATTPDEAAAQMADAQTPTPAQSWAAATTPAELADAAPAPLADETTTLPSIYAPSVAENTADSAATLMTQGAAALDDGQIVDGRWALNAALLKMGDDKRAPHLRQILAGLNAGIFLGTSVVPEDPAAKFVTVQPGDSFLKLGRKYAIPAALLESINPGINPRNLKPLTGVKIIEGPFHLRVFKRAGRIDLYARDMYVKSFPGEVEEGTYLPIGIYRVSTGNKIQVAARQWIGIERIADSSREPLEGWLYGSSGPRIEKGLNRASGVKIQDADLAQLYNVLVEQKSLVRVEP